MSSKAKQGELSETRNSKLMSTISLEEKVTNQQEERAK